MLNLVLASTLLGAACAGTTSPEPRSATASPASSEYAEQAACFVEVPRVAVPLAELSDGVLLTYSTTVNDVGSLQAAVHGLARGQSLPAADRTVGPDQPALRTGDLGAPPGTAVLFPGARAEVTDTDTGARLTLRPLDVAARRAFRAELAGLAANRPSSCPPDVRMTTTVPGPG